MTNRNDEAKLVEQGAWPERDIEEKALGQRMVEAEARWRDPGSTHPEGIAGMMNNPQPTAVSVSERLEMVEKMVADMSRMMHQLIARLG